MARRGILIVEDEILLGDDCASHVKEAGLEVIGPYSKLNDVPEDLTGIAGAILDINVAGRSAYRLMDRLLEMNVPVVFYTGYDVRHDPGKYAEIPRVPKPAACVYAVQELIRGLDV